MPRKARLLQLSRKIHLYFGLFISPALLFFAFSGALQTLGYHEPSSNYKPPAWMAVLGQIHKKQTSVVPVRRGGPAEPGHSDPLRAGTGAPALSAETPVRPEPSGDPSPHQHPARIHQTAGPGVATPPAAPGDQDAARPAPLRSGPAPGGQPPVTLQAKQKQHLPLKIFFVLVSLGLFTSTVTGIYMSYKYDRNKILLTVVLLAGLVIPLLLLRL